MDSPNELLPRRGLVVVGGEREGPWRATAREPVAWNSCAEVSIGQAGGEPVWNGVIAADPACKLWGDASKRIRASGSQPCVDCPVRGSGARAREYKRQRWGQRGACVLSP